jgi:hypothetical protein
VEIKLIVTNAIIINLKDVPGVLLQAIIPEKYGRNMNQKKNKK